MESGLAAQEQPITGSLDDAEVPLEVEETAGNAEDVTTCGVADAAEMAAIGLQMAAAEAEAEAAKAFQSHTSDGELSEGDCRSLPHGPGLVTGKHPFEEDIAEVQDAHTRQTPEAVHASQESAASQGVSNRCALYREGPNFDELMKEHPVLECFMTKGADGRYRFDLASQGGSLALSRALLQQDLSIDWSVPEEFAGPCIVHRAGYVHWLNDLLMLSSPSGVQPHRGLDIGCGASYMYCLLAAAMYGWKMVGADVSDVALEWSKHHVERNPHLAHLLSIRDCKTEDEERDSRRSKKVDLQQPSEPSQCHHLPNVKACTTCAPHPVPAQGRTPYAFTSPCHVDCPTETQGEWDDPGGILLGAIQGRSIIPLSSSPPGRSTEAEDKVEKGSPSSGQVVGAGSRLCSSGPSASHVAGAGSAGHGAPCDGAAPLRQPGQEGAEDSCVSISPDGNNLVAVLEEEKGEASKTAQAPAFAGGTRAGDIPVGGADALPVMSSPEKQAGLLGKASGINMTAADQYDGREDPNNAASTAAFALEDDGNKLPTVGAQASDCNATLETAHVPPEEHPEERAHEVFSFTICNPPPFDSQCRLDAQQLQQQRQGHAPSSAAAACAGAPPEELAYPGGELAFVMRMIEDSVRLGARVHWYSTLLNKKSTLRLIRRELHKRHVTAIRTTTFSGLGGPSQYAIAWSFEVDPQLANTPLPSALEVAAAAEAATKVLKRRIAFHVPASRELASSSLTPGSPAVGTIWHDEGAKKLLRLVEHILLERNARFPGVDRGMMMMTVVIPWDQLGLGIPPPSPSSAAAAASKRQKSVCEYSCTASSAASPSVDASLDAIPSLLLRLQVSRKQQEQGHMLELDASIPKTSTEAERLAFAHVMATVESSVRAQWK